MQFFALLNGRPTLFQGLFLKGSPLSPSFAFADDPITGFFLYGTSQLGVAVSGDWSVIFAPGGLIYGRQGNNYISLGSSGNVALTAGSTNQPIALTPSGHATSGGFTVSRLTSTAQTLGLFTFGTDEMMNIVGAGYAGTGSRTNVPFIFYSNNTERLRLTNSTGNLLIGNTTDNALGKVQVTGSLTVAEAFGTGLFGYFGGSDLVLGTLNGTTLVLRTNNTAALQILSNQNAFFSSGVWSNGSRGFTRYKSANGTTASPVEDRVVGFSNTNDLLFDVGMFALNSLTDNSAVWLRFKTLDSSGTPQIAFTLDSSQNATTVGTLITAASVAAKAGLRLPHGAAPTAPVNGDIWTTTAGLFVRVNGATVGPLT